MKNFEQQFPFRGPNGVEHKRWNVDVGAAAKLGGHDANRLAAEIEDMQRHLPRWVLTVVAGAKLQKCDKCEGLLVFDDGVRCVACGRKAKLAGGARPAWFGLLPPIGITGLAQIREALMARPPPQHVVGRRDGIGEFLLVPLIAIYPPSYPAQPLEVHYLPEFRLIPGVPREAVSHTFHMIGPTRMCLFASGEWLPEMTCRQTLQQRAYAHVIKFLNYANGKRDAFAIVS